MADIFMEYARLLTNESITLTYSKEADTAYFDVESRSIVMPLFEYLDRECNAALTAHECGHALYSKYTPEETIELSEKYGDIFNVIEDGFIERMIVSKYPGILNFFKKAYSTFVEQDFFGVKDKDLNTLQFIEKMNLNLKLNRIGINIPMDNPVENSFLHRAYIVNSNDEVKELVKDIYEYLKENYQESEEEDSTSDTIKRNGSSGFNRGRKGRMLPEGEDSKGNTEEDNSDNTKTREKSEEVDNLTGNSPLDDLIHSETMNHLKESIKKDIDSKKASENSKNNGKIPIIIESGNIRKDLMDDISEYIPKLEIFFEKHPDAYIENMASIARKLSKNAVTYFEKLKQGKAIKNERNKTTGKIDPRRLAHYKTSTNLFIKRKLQNNQQNHGVVMLIDYSSSMHGNIHSVLLQTAIVTEFCKSCGIPFSILAFGCNYFNADKPSDMYSGAYELPDHITGRTTRNLFNNSVIKIADEKNYSLNGLLSFYPAFFYSSTFVYNFNRLFFKNFSLHMNNTPTDLGLLCAYEEMKEMKELYNLDKTNLIIITDGDYNNNIPYTKLASDYFKDGTIPAGIDEDSFRRGLLEYNYKDIVFNSYHINSDAIMKNNEVAVYDDYFNYLESILYMIKRDFSASIVFSYIENSSLSTLFCAYEGFNRERTVKFKESEENSTIDKSYVRKVYNRTHEYMIRVIDDYYKCGNPKISFSNIENVIELKNLSAFDKAILTDCRDINKLSQEIIDNDDNLMKASSFNKLKNEIKKNFKNYENLEMYVKYLIEEIA